METICYSILNKVELTTIPSGMLECLGVQMFQEQMKRRRRRCDGSSLFRFGQVVVQVSKAEQKNQELSMDISEEIFDKMARGW